MIRTFLLLLLLLIFVNITPKILKICQRLADIKITVNEKGRIMDISKINAAIEGIGYNSAGIQGTSEQDAQKLAQENRISIEEAKSILREAEEKAEENDKIMAQEAALMEQILNQPDEEDEIQIVDDADFDKFLQEESPEQKMQDILSKQQTLQSNNFQNQAKPENIQNIFSQENNPFLKMKF